MASGIFVRLCAKLMKGVRSLDRKIIRRHTRGEDAPIMEPAGPASCDHTSEEDACLLTDDTTHFDRKGDNRTSYIGAFPDITGTHIDRPRPPAAISTPNAPLSSFPLPAPPSPPPPPPPPPCRQPNERTLIARRVWHAGLDRGLIPPAANDQDWRPWVRFALEPENMTFRRHGLNARRRWKHSKPRRQRGLPFDYGRSPSGLRNEVRLD